MLKWEDRLRLIGESPYYEIPLKEFRVGLKCEYCANWASTEWCFGAAPDIYHIFELSRGFNIDSDSLEFVPHVVTEDDVKMAQALSEVGCYYKDTVGVTYFRGVKANRL